MPQTHSASHDHAAGAEHLAPIGVGLLGCGTVGLGVAKLIQSHRLEYQHRLGRTLELRRVAVRDLGRDRGIDAAHLTLSPDEVISDPGTHIVVEVMGGAEPARTLILQAIAHGKHVVTANKEVIARHGSEIFSAARDKGVAVFIEGTVGGGIPIIMPIKASLAANRITQIAGIVNGTTNFILTAMTQKGQSLEAALAEAQRLGYAEANPAADVEAHDAVFKMAILASTIFSHRVRVEDVYREGITHLTAADIQYAGELGYVIKLLGVARHTDGQMQVRVHPALVSKAHPLAHVNGVSNAIAVRGDAVGEVMFQGPGAGQFPTASAVMGDVLNIASDLDHANRLMGCLHTGHASVGSIDDLFTQFYVRLLAQDEPGVIAALGNAFAHHGISILSLVQKGQRDGVAEIVLVTHTVRERAMREALAELADHPTIQSIASVIRVEALNA
jgi:homoserine dehydrogenase